MGKQKQAQRTKGNVKPSSSARAAELLATAGGASQGFVGFGTMSGDLGYVPAASGSDDVDNSIDAQFRLVLRKMSKRDAVTKLKALQEFAELCKDKDLDSVKTVLPFWPRIYNKMAIDHDRRVREATQQGLEKLVSRVSRCLAPHLKALMGAWLVAQSDPYAPAASAAKSAFLAAFPPAKQTEAIVFCKEEVLSHLHENLLIHTAQTLGDTKTTEPEDIEAKYQRVLCASLAALRTFLGSVPLQQQSPLVDKYRTMVSDGKFWKLAKHKQAMIVGAFYSALSGFCQYHPNVAREFSDKISQVTLHNLDITEPLVCGPLWEAVLYTLSTIEDCWTHVNARKGVLPKLWSLLKQGGNGNAAVIYPNLLPFLSKTPSEVIGDGTEFYSQFFTNIKLGLSQQKATQSASECNAIVSAFMECLQHVLYRNLDNKTLVQSLIEDQLVTLVGAAILEDTPNLAATSLFPMVVELLTSLHKMSENTESASRESASSCLTEIIESITDLNILQLEHADSSKVLGRFGHFLCTFKQPKKESSTRAKTKGSRIMFADDYTPEQTPKEKVVDEDSPLIVENGPVYPMICSACLQAYKNSVGNKSLPNLTFFAGVFNSYGSNDLARNVWEHSKDTNSLITTVSEWMCAMNTGDSEERVASAFVDILSTLFNLCAADKKTVFLSEAMEAIPVMAVFQKFAQNVYRESSDQSVRLWFKGPNFGEKMVAVAKQLCAQCTKYDSNRGNIEEDVSDLDTHWDLLSLAFTVDDNLEPLLGENYVAQVLQEILKSLPSPTSLSTLPQGQISQCVSFVCDVASNFFTNIKGCLSLQPAEELLLALFQISCQDVQQSDSVSEKVQKTWQSGVQSLFVQNESSIGSTKFFKEATSYVKNKVQHETDTYERLERLVNTSLALIHCVSASTENSSDSQDSVKQREFAQSAAQQMMQSLSLGFGDHKNLPQWQVGTLVSHDLPFITMATSMDTKPPTLCPKCVASIAFTSKLMASLATSNVAMETDGACTRPVLTEVDRNLVLDMWFGLAFCQAMIKPKINANTLTHFGKVHQMLEDNITSLYKNLSSEVKTDILKAALTKSLEEGGLWSLCLHEIINRCTDKSTIQKVVTEQGGLDRYERLTVPSLHTLVTLLPHLPSSDRRQISDIHAALLLSTLADSLTEATGACGHLSVVSRALSLQESGADPEMSQFDPDATLGVLEQIQSWRDDHDQLFLFDSPVKSASWPVVTFNTEIIHFLKNVVVKMPEKITDKLWDFILCSLVVWVQSCNESKHTLTSDPKTQLFAVATFDLLAETAAIIQSSAVELPPNLSTEWSEFFSEGAYSLILPLFVMLAEHTTSRTPNPGHDFTIRALSRAVAFCPVEHISKHQLPAKLVAGDPSNLSDSHQTALNHLCPLLLAANRSVQIGAYKLLLSLLPEVVKEEVEQEPSDKLEERLPRSPPLALMNVLDTTGEGVNLLLGEVAEDEPITIDHRGDEYTVTMGYLLSWKLLLAYLRNAKVELRAEYAYFLRDHDKVNALIPCLMKLMPQNPQVSEGQTTQNLFEVEPALSTKAEASSREVQHVACSLYAWVVQDLPAVLRQWYNDQDKRITGLVNKYTTKFVSPAICTRELAAVSASDRVLENMTIRTRPVAREVVATYSLEEISIELVVTLPTNHPLGPMSIDCGKRIGVANTQWRTWMLQLTTFLHKQNGSILDGLTLWKRNVDKRFEGVEECMICFSVIHGSNFQVPKLQCKTCKKRFHSACLYKWFNTSNNSSCPLCRNLF